MDIHVVKQGDTIYSIAAAYGVSPEQLITNNELSNPNSLVISQTNMVLTGTSPSSDKYIFYNYSHPKVICL